MKKLFLLLFTAILCFASHAQIKVNTPVWNRFVQITAQGVNLRKSPSTSGQRFTEFSLQKGDLAPVLEETEEWVKLYTFMSPLSYVWVSKQFTKEVLPEPIVLDYSNFKNQKSDEDGMVEGSVYYPVTKGKFKGTVFEEATSIYGQARSWTVFSAMYYKQQSVLHIVNSGDTGIFEDEDEFAKHTDKEIEEIFQENFFCEICDIDTYLEFQFAGKKELFRFDSEYPFDTEEWVIGDKSR